MKTTSGYIVIIVVILNLLISVLPVHAADSDSGETPEIQFSSGAAKDLRDQAATLSSPVKIYEYLRNNAEYALYHGSRSGSINSFLGLRGSDVDLASSLIAMYRSRGIRARYAVGTVRLSADQVTNWLGVKNFDLAVNIMNLQGIQNVNADTNKKYVDFEHVWVEAYIPFGNYRGAGQDAASISCSASSDCHWVALDPSFKLKEYNQALNVSKDFDYTGYYNAILNNDGTRMNKNPLEIYEEQILSYLQTSYPGKTLEDVAYTGTIISQDNQILPASLPYTVVDTPRRYNSVADHDAAVGPNNPDKKKWKKTVSLQFTYYLSTGTVTNISGGTYSLVDVSTKSLTVSYDNTAGKLVIQMDGIPVYTVPNQIPLYNKFAINLTMDGTPASSPSGTDFQVTAEYDNCQAGGYYLVATGGETSNWTQVHRAADQLLAANQKYTIVYDASESTCDSTTGIGCTPYLNIVSSGTKLIDNKSAMDELAGGLLQVAAMQYYAKFRHDIERLDALNHIKTPIAGFLGVVSSTPEVEYIDGTAFSVLPGGLLIDMRGIAFKGSWSIFSNYQPDNRQFKLITHIGSSLEHEIWQELTGYDAISTVRGIQIAVANGATLLDLNSSNVETMYDAMGYTTSVPSSFSRNERIIYNTKMISWMYDWGYNVDGTKSFVILKKRPTGTSDNNWGILYYTNNTFDGFIGDPRNVDDSTCYYPSLCCFHGWESYLNSSSNYYNQGGCYYTGCQMCISWLPAGTDIATAKAMNQQDYANYRLSVGAWQFDFLDENKGFNPWGTGNYVYRSVYGLSDWAQPTYLVAYWRDILLFETQGWNNIVVPSKLATGSTFRFSTDIWYHYNSSGTMTEASFDINNMQGVFAGGGYVDANQPLIASQAIPGTAIITPTFNNSVFTDKNTISQTNNDAVKTPSTSDPVSTITGNNYHDETDFTIKGRGLNIAFTRTYNSAPSSVSADGPLGYGWTHSYNMKLVSNDYGSCPNCNSAQAWENNTGKTSSITYTDERGGQHNYLVNEVTLSVTPPTGEFDKLTFDSPSAGYHTITFRNGVQYIFQGPSTIKSIPGTTATLYQILDPYGNTLTFSYSGGKLTAITDNLSLAGRTGLAITYYAGTKHIEKITDWSGRKWTYTYDSSGNLVSVTNPLTKTLSYAYKPASSHYLTAVTLPETRDGKQVGTVFAYYQNGRTFNYKNSLGYGETMDYDLYRKITRVTDPRGFIREYEYDQNGLLTKLSEPDGGILSFGSNTTILLRNKKTDALNYVTTYSYRTDFATIGGSNTHGNVTQETDPLGSTLQYYYGIYDQVVHSKDKNNNGRTMAYYTTTDSNTGALVGKLQSVTLDSLNGSTNVLMQSYTYNPDGTIKQMVEYIDPAKPSRKRITDYVYQDNGLNVQSMTVSGSGQTVQTTYTYDSLGRKKTATLQRRRSASDPTLISLTTSYEYDALDRVTRTTDPLGNIAEIIYDDNGKVKQTNAYYKKPDNTFDSRLIVSRTYDAADRMISETDVYGKATTYTYDNSGNVISVTDANGHTSKYEYDEMNRRTATIDANGFRTETVYDLAGHPRQTINPLGKTVSTVYDALGRPVTVTDALGYQTTFAYDANGNVTKMTDANANAGLQPKNTYGCTIYKIYDELNRVKQEVDALNGVTSYTYDLLGNITSITDAENHTTTFIYDDLGRLTETRDPLYAITGKSITFTYDQAGNVLTKTKRSGEQTTYTYDNLNRLIQAQHTSPSAGTTTETTGYDIYGNKQNVSNNNVTYTYTYDLKNRPLSKTDSRTNLKLSYTYDSVGNPLTRSNYDGTTSEYRYDSTNRLVAERNNAFLEVSYYYDGAGRLLDRILSNGAKTEYTWDDGNRLLIHNNTSANGTTVNNTSYVRDRLGNITSQTDTTGTTSFVYDALYRITSATYPVTTNNQSYTYDKVGNRKTITKNGSTLAYIFDVDNRLTEIRQGSPTGALLNSYVYDADNNLTTKKNSAGSAIQTIAYDAKGRAKTITTSGIGTATNLTYDPYDYRIAKTDSTGSRTYLLEGEHLEAMLSGSSWKAMYLRGVVIDEIVNAYYFGTDGKWVNYTFHHDNLQSLLGLSGHEGSVLQTITYDPFGLKTSVTGSAAANYLHYAGREEDTDTGLYNYRARLYDPSIGRFITEDPKGFAAGVNFYAYVGNNPINANDPYGFDGQAAAAWALDQVGKTNYQYFSTHPESRGGLTSLLGGAGSFKCNAFVWDALTAGGDPPGRMEGGRIPVAREWADPSVNIPSYVVVSDGSLHSGDVIAAKTEHGSYHVGLYAPILDSDNGTVSAATGGLGGFFGEVTHSNWGFREGQNPTVRRLWNDTNRDFDLGEVRQTSSTSQLNFNYTTFNSSENAAAAGGYLIYPNKPNTNMMQNVYSK